VLEHDQEVAVRAVEGLVGIHVLSRGEDEDSDTRFHGRVAGSRDEVQAVHPVYRLVQVERVPAELVRDLVQAVVFWVGVVGGRFSWFEGGVG